MELLYRYAMVVVVVVVAAGELRRHSSPATPTACRPFFQEKRTNTILIPPPPLPRLKKSPKKNSIGPAFFDSFVRHHTVSISLYILCTKGLSSSALIIGKYTYRERI
jgi:hypothetical protein